MIDQTILLIILPLTISFLIAFFATPLSTKIAWKLKMVDEPSMHKHPKVIHTYPVPRGGGIPILIALLVTSFIFLPMDQHLRGILLGAVFASIVGLFDDRFDLNPYLRLFTSFITAGIVVAAGIGISFVSSPFSGIIDLSGPKITFDLLGEQRNLWILADFFALFWIAWCMNFIGWSGGVEGQLPGVVVIAALTIGLLSLRFSADITQWPVAILAAITSGAYLGFLPFNFYPQKIMPGYSGKSLAGFLLATLSILATAKIGTLVVVLGVPLIDAFYTIIRRVAKGHSPFWGDRGHLHHKLLDLGWSKKRIAVSYWGITFILGILALNLNSQHKLYTMITITTLIGGFLLWITYFTKSQSPQDPDNG